MTYGDMVGLEIYLVQEWTGIWIRCLEIVDGPGFYNCDSESAQILVIKGPNSDTSSNFVLCGIKRFESRSANLAISSASTNPVHSHTNTGCSYEAINAAINHPITYDYSVIC